MPAWINTINFISARLRRAVFVMLILAFLQAIPGYFETNRTDAGLQTNGLTLRRAID